MIARRRNRSVSAPAAAPAAIPPRLRGRTVLLDVDAARIFDQSVEALRDAVSGSPERFPEDFTFRLTAEEARAAGLDADAATLAFTERGLLMLCAVLPGAPAVHTLVELVRAMARPRQLILTRGELPPPSAHPDTGSAGTARTIFDAAAALVHPVNRRTCNRMPTAPAP